MTIDQALWQDPNRVSGAVCFRDTRIPVSILSDYLDAEDIKGFYDNYPDVSPEMVDAVLEAPRGLLEAESPKPSERGT